MDEFKITNEDGDIVARDNLYIALFKKVPFVQMMLEAATVFERWMDIIPEDTLNWCVISKTQESYKPFTKSNLGKCRKIFSQNLASKKDVYIDLVGPQPYGADFRIQIWGWCKPQKDGYLDPTNLIEMRFPVNFMETYGEEAFVRFAADCFQLLVCDSGLATFGYSAGSSADYDEASQHVIPLAFRHPGFDLAANGGAAKLMGKKCRGARWLTMLSKELIEQAGGQAKLQNLANQDVEFVMLNEGIMLRAGSQPEIGDTNRTIKVPKLCAVAKAIEPVTFFHDNSLLPLLDDDPDKRDRWERRFWQDEKL